MGTDISSSHRYRSLIPTKIHIATSFSHRYRHLPSHRYRYLLLTQVKIPPPHTGADSSTLHRYRYTSSSHRCRYLHLTQVQRPPPHTGKDTSSSYRYRYLSSHRDSYLLFTQTQLLPLPSEI
jgi:hypothetical protein